MRFAFLTPEFPTNFPNSGGLASFLGRLSKALVQRSHRVEIITPAESKPGEQEWNGVTVRHVDVPDFVPNWFDRGPARFFGRISTENLRRVLNVSRSLAASLEQLHQESPFDVVHGSDFGLTTLYVPRLPGRTVVVRSSSPSDQYRRWWGAAFRLDHPLFSQLERRLFQQADLVYAPSRLTADYYARRAAVQFDVIRPPFPMPVHDRPVEFGLQLPSRYLLHFGNINRVKGSDVLARSLQIAWRSEPDLQMVWAGTAAADSMRHFHRFWRGFASRVIWLGPLSREEMNQVVVRSSAVVAPSRIDNLPNSVLEAQASQIPVIGTFRSSVDEIVIDGVTGRLVEPGDPAGLAAALISAWRREHPFTGKAVPVPPLFSEMEPDVAVSRLINAIQMHRARTCVYAEEPERE